MSLGKLVFRVVVGSVFAAHGLQKLRGYWGGPGLDGTEKMVESMNMHPAPVQARAVAIAETVGGAAIIAGAATPVAAAALIATMVTAVRKVHLGNGPWNSQGGYEFNAVLTAGLLAIVNDGPGTVSLDAAFGNRRWGLKATLFALIAGIAGSIAAVDLGARLAPDADAPATSAAATEADAS